MCINSSGSSRVQWQALVNTAEVPGSVKGGSFLISWESNSCSRRTLLHEVCCSDEALWSYPPKKKTCADYSVSSKQ